MKMEKIFIKCFFIVIMISFCICARMSNVHGRSNNSGDVKALRKIIAVQNKKGAKVSKNINNKKQYVWDNKTGRLRDIKWRSKQLKGSINFNALTGLRKLNVSKNNITKLSIQKLVKLVELDCSNNKLKNIIIKSNTALEDINCSHNYLKTLSVSKNIDSCDLDCSYNRLKKLEINTCIFYFNCAHNQLKKLNLNKEVVQLDCSHNQLTELNIHKKMGSLWDVDCSYNKLKKITLAGHKYLRWFNCSHNQLKELNIHKSVTSLWDVDCSYNNLKALNVDYLKKLYWLKCDHNQLTALNIQKASKNLEKIICDNKVQLSGFNPEIIYDSVKDTQVSFLSVDKETMDIEITNNTGKWLCIQESFILEKKVNGQWETMKCTEETTVNKLLFVPKSKTREFVIKWKDYFGKKLGKGEYRMKLLGVREFTIK